MSKGADPIESCAGCGCLGLAGLVVFVVGASICSELLGDFFALFEDISGMITGGGVILFLLVGGIVLFLMMDDAQRG